jgi:hypothetical protein
VWQKFLLKRMNREKGANKQKNRAGKLSAAEGGAGSRKK